MCMQHIVQLAACYWKYTGQNCSGGKVLYWIITDTCIVLGSKYQQLFGMHALRGCDATSYPHDKGKISTPNTLCALDIQGLMDVLGEVATT